MAIYGVGSHFPGERIDMTRKFIASGRFVIGYSRSQHPDYYSLLDKVQNGDTVFIKSRFMKNRPLRVKAIGVVIDSRVCSENGMEGKEGIRVNWVRDLTDNPVDLQKDNSNDGSTGTIYQETDPVIVKKILSLFN